MYRFQKNGLCALKGRLSRIDLIQIWKAFHRDIDVGLADIFGWIEIHVAEVMPINSLFPCVEKLLKRGHCFKMCDYLDFDSCRGCGF